ncbi:phage holin family protein [Thermocoleostomius sinensis]|jgi:putative membrane protein|uniref:Phage holin family protein n=1 Tax=Thermocoleostomius sinensis A174 TaxID=2016057 RepID=A0A9E8ZC63_9CYAN|nr:phage holin family protein [Thermocoleostomius sinensis]WAL60565.1 phage holin family protein [Thermocoleostomius sinensis A174]
MIGFALTTLITALSLLIVDLVVPGVVLANFPAAIIAAIVIGFINAFVRPILSVLSLPVNFVTLGAFSLVINGLCFWLASLLVPGFAVHGLIAFLLGPVVLSLGTTFLNSYFARKGIGSSATVTSTSTLETTNK